MQFWLLMLGGIMVFRIKILVWIVLSALFVFGCGSETVNQQPETIEDELDVIRDAEGITDFLTAEEVIDRFVVFELPVGETIIYDEETCPNDLLGRPGQYVGKADWEDTRVEQYGDFLTGGTIEIFEDDATLVKRKEYLEPFLEEAVFLQYMFIHKNVIVRVDKELTPSQADEYKDALESL
jgi:hypothetical protein